MFVVGCLFAVALLETASAQTFSLGNCDLEIQTVKNFDKTKYAGKWYEIKRSFNAIEENTKCYRINCNLAHDAGYDVIGELASIYENNKYYTMNLTAKPDDGVNSPEKMTLRPGYISDTQPIWILDTDYDNYAIVYSCSNALKGKLENVWIISRTPKLDQSIVAKAERELKKRSLNFDLITEIQDCKFLDF